MYKLITYNHKTNESEAQRFETLERAQMAMLEHMCRVQLACGADWSQVLETLLGLLADASSGELCAELESYDAPDVVVSSHSGMVCGCGAAVSFFITDVSE